TQKSKARTINFFMDAQFGYGLRKDFCELSDVWRIVGVTSSHADTMLDRNFILLSNFVKYL
ncbi:MAG: hypothetical protein SFV52_13050, partial [Saprospiraceae bacterium]|nr:hypothetical protein [Saprospiraceae bacterium]